MDKKRMGKCNSDNISQQSSQSSIFHSVNSSSPSRSGKWSSPSSVVADFGSALSRRSWSSSQSSNFLSVNSSSSSLSGSWSSPSSAVVDFGSSLPQRSRSSSQSSIFHSVSSSSPSRSGKWSSPSSAVADFGSALTRRSRTSAQSSIFHSASSSSPSRSGKWSSPSSAVAVFGSALPRRSSAQLGLCVDLPFRQSSSPSALPLPTDWLSMANYFYVVWIGWIPGIYASWDMCSRQTNMFPGAIFQSYHTYEEAHNAYYGTNEVPITPAQNIYHNAYYHTYEEAYNAYYGTYEVPITPARNIYHNVGAEVPVDYSAGSSSVPSIVYSEPVFVPVPVPVSHVPVPVSHVPAPPVSVSPVPVPVPVSHVPVPPVLVPVPVPPVSVSPAPMPLDMPVRPKRACLSFLHHLLLILLCVILLKYICIA